MKPLLLMMIASCAAGLGMAGCSTEDDPSPNATAAAENEKSGEDKPGPELEIPEGPPPKRFIVRDLRKGSGAVARGGDEVTVRYIGTYWNGEEHSNSWVYADPPTFELGDGQLSRPLDMGIRGMREGGRRELLAPSNLVFYPDVPHSELGPEYALLFKVELIKVR